MLVHSVQRERFHNASHTVTYGIPLQNSFLKQPALPVKVILNHDYLM
jgi:hypothetical protein